GRQRLGAQERRRKKLVLGRDFDPLTRQMEHDAAVHDESGHASTTLPNPSHEARSSSSACTAFVMGRVNFTSSWIAFTRSTQALRSAVASTFPIRRSPWRDRKSVV